MIPKAGDLVAALRSDLWLVVKKCAGGLLEEGDKNQDGMIVRWQNSVV